MIGKISTVFSVLAIGASIYCLIFLNGKITEFEENTEKNKKFCSQEAEKLALDKEEFNKHYGVKYSERAKNQLLESKSLKPKSSFSTNASVGKTKSSLESLTSRNYLWKKILSLQSWNFKQRLKTLKRC